MVELNIKKERIKMPVVVDINNCEKYMWEDNCFGWHLLKKEELSVISEEVPAGKSEKRHFHKEGRQFFYILNGKATMELEGIDYELLSGQGIGIEPGQKHKFKNTSGFMVTFIVVTAPKKAEDRVDIE